MRANAIRRKAERRERAMAELKADIEEQLAK